MTRYLIDSCTFLWITTDDPKLTPRVKGLFADPNNEIFFSVASLWEITLKYQAGRLTLPESPEIFLPDRIQKYRLKTLPITQEDILVLYRLEPIHRDPFDRLLISQAIVQGLTLLTPDIFIQKYPVRIIWS